MKIRVAILAGLYLAGLAARGDDAPHFVFTPGHEYTYKVEYTSFWRDPAFRDLPNWEGEMKLWPIAVRADGTTLVRARLAMNPADEAGAIRKRDDTVAWAEFSVGDGGIDDYEFSPHSDEAPTIRPAFPLPPPLLLKWTVPGTDETRDVAFVPGTSPLESPWKILIEDHNRFLTSWQATRHTTITYDAKAGRVLDMETRTDFLAGPHIWTTTKVTFIGEATLDAATAARIGHDSGELAGAQAEFQALWREANDPLDERAEFARRADASTKRMLALGAAIHSPEFKEDTVIIQPDTLHKLGVRAGEVFTAREALLNQPSPDWTATDLAGQAHALGDYRGRVLVLFFWEADEPPLDAAAPFVNQIAADYAGRPVAVVGVDKFDGKTWMSEAIDRTHLAGVQLAGLPILRAFKLRALPSFVVLDANGVVRYEHAGWNDTTDHALRTEIDELLPAASKN